MAEEEKKESENSLIDPIYEKFVRGVTRSIGSTEFYEFFMDSISRAQNQFQFSNRKMIKNIDMTWVDAVEEALDAMQNIVSSPRNVIKEEDLIVNVANARKAGAETVRHLAMHSSLVENFDEERSEVRPSKLMQRYREEDLGLYENRLVFTTMEYAYHFVKIRHDALMESMSDEFGAKLKVQSDMDSATEHVHVDMFLHIKEIDSVLETDKKNGDAFARISRIYRILGIYMNSTFAQQMTKLPRVKGTINKTNILKKNKDYKEVLKLFEFLRSYTDIGYTIKVVEQNPEINEQFQDDIYRNILFNYLILKGYLEDEEDRQIPTKAKGRKRTLKPKFIHEILEELTEDYDLPDVEIRKVLIEELTKDQLMKEEASERRRLVEEQEQRRKEEEERIKAEKKAEQERIRAEKAAERERIRLEKEAEELRKKQERMEREAEDRRRSKMFKAELTFFETHLEDQKDLRREAAEVIQNMAAQEDYADAVEMLENEEKRKKEDAKRAQAKKKEEQERLLREQQLAEEKARLDAEREQARLEEELRQKAIIFVAPYVVELEAFSSYIQEQQEKRAAQERQRLEAEAQREETRKARSERVAKG
jgi:hypothetical protein